jgi:ribosomal protein L35
MPKLKTRKAIAKRFKLSKPKKCKKKKIIMRRSGQDHFNAKESGNVTRKKRRNVQISWKQHEAIRKALPYS